MDRTQELQALVLEADKTNELLFIRGGGTKSFYGRGARDRAKIISTRAHQGVIDYEPSELVVRVRAGTRLKELQEILAEQNQMLAFEPPLYGSDSTVGGAIASGLSGSGRPWRGGVRDHVLGITLLSGQGQCLSFGGQVMKNVAGYDVSRLIAGSLGILGLILDVSLKVIPIPEKEETVSLAFDRSSSMEKMKDLTLSGLPVTGCMHHEEKLWVRFSGSEKAVKQSMKQLGGQVSRDNIWQRVDCQRVKPMEESPCLWRLSTHLTSDCYVSKASLIEWGGAIRWLSEPAFDPRNGLPEDVHATLFRNNNLSIETGEEVFNPLEGVVKQIHLNLKRVFDPKGLFNKGQMYSWL